VLSILLGGIDELDTRRECRLFSRFKYILIQVLKS
jgi:hypothetical protein